MDVFFATVGLVEAVGAEVGQLEQGTEAVAAVPVQPESASSGLAVTIDVTAIATVGLVLAFSYGIVRTFRDKP